MKLRVFGAIGITVSLASTMVLARATAYRFVTVDIRVPDRPGTVVIPEDINDDGMIVSSIFSPSWGGETLIAEPAGQRSRVLNDDDLQLRRRAFRRRVGLFNQHKVRRDGVLRDGSQRRENLRLCAQSQR